jgi:hypothetical protein
LQTPEEELASLIQQYRRKGLLLDSNLLLLLVAGRHDRRLLTSFGRVKEFGPSNFDLLDDIVRKFDRLITTPHVLTEVNGLSNKIPGRDRYGYFNTLKQVAADMDEHAVPFATLSESIAYQRLGVADAAIEIVAEQGYMVLSIDLNLVVSLQSRRIAAFNFNNVRLFV